MGATQNIQNPFPLPDNLTQDWLIPYAFNGAAIAVSVGDAMYVKGQATLGAGGDVVYPADQLASLGTEALDQAQLAALFIGFSQQKILSTEVNPNKRMTIRVKGPVLAKCPSQTWKKGDMVGIFSNGTVLDPQQVDKVTQRFLAFGICIKDQPTASTTVTFEVDSRYADDIMDSRQFASLGEQQSMNAVNVLTDANQTFTVSSPYFSQMTNTAARNITLPKESASKGLNFRIHNLAASVGAVNYLKSDGVTAALGTNAIPAGKTGDTFCDGLTWYCTISA